MIYSALPKKGKAKVADYQFFPINGENYSLYIIFPFLLIRTLEQTNILQNGLNQGLANNREQATSQFNILSAKLDAQTVMINDKFCQLEMREMQNTIAQLREEKAALTASALSQQQTQNIVGQLRPTAVPAYPSCSPYQAYTWGQVFGGGCCNNGCGCNNGCCNNNAAV